MLYALVLSPVSHIPGPFLNRISRLPLYRATLKLRRSEYAQHLTEKYGPIVVIAPDQVHTVDDAAMKVIYNRHSVKTRFYSGMGSWKGVVVTLGFLHYREAAPTRNNLIMCFQNKNLEILTESIGEHITTFLRVLRDKSTRHENIDGMMWFRLLALDIVTDVLWGDSSNLLAHADSSTPDFLRRFNAFSKYNAMKSSIPGFEWMITHFGNKKWRTLQKDCGDMDVSAREALEKWRNGKVSHHIRDVLSMLKDMEANDDPAKRIPNDHIPAYMVEMMAAGSSTTTGTAAFTCRMLARNPEVQKKLRQELFEAFPDARSLDVRQSQNLPYLDAAIRETMRLWPMIPGPLERILADPITVNGKTVPPGVVASTSALSQGRLEEVFPEANSWIPERWFNATERMHLNWTPFGYGSRSCPGSNLALTELRHMMCNIFRNFKAVPPIGHEDEDLGIMDVFAAAPKTGTCWLRFENAPELVW